MNTAGEGCLHAPMPSETTARPLAEGSFKGYATKEPLTVQNCSLFSRFRWMQTMASRFKHARYQLTFSRPS